MHLKPSLWSLIVAALIVYSIWDSLARKKRAQLRRDNPPLPVRAYGFEKPFKVVELGNISLSRALQLFDDRVTYAGLKFDDAEEAIAKTTIGFCRDDEDFIEIGVVRASLINVRAGVGVVEADHEEQIDMDVDAARSLIKSYFEKAREFPSYWQSLKGRKRVR